jgi:cyclopropane fatty-acyl-phospholipid synthase-like methyltransferase
MSKNLSILEWNRRKWERKNQAMYGNGREENGWPWYCADLDRDIESFLYERGIASGRVLDLGTCSGSQAIQLAKRGFDVVGTDVSSTALEQARKSSKGLPVDARLSFVLDDIVETKLEPSQFDLIIDRAVFHAVCVFAAHAYIKNLAKLLKLDGRVILKVMSHKESHFVNSDVVGGRAIPMPYRFTERELRAVFERDFEIEKLEDSVFYSSVLEEPAKAYLAILSKRPATS